MTFTTLSGISLEPPFSINANPLFNATAAASQTTPSPCVPLPPPIPQQQSCTVKLSLPAVYHDSYNSLREVDDGDPDKFEKYLEWELSVSRLNKIHRYLWLAGRPTCARPLHRQVMLDRQIIVTEQADLHLVWQESRMFLKPLPEFLLDFDFWKQHLCRSPDLHEAASGLLLSYVWLVCHQSDLKIAQEKGLLPSRITWAGWSTFIRSLLHNINYDSLVGISLRYHYGELRFSRLNWIYRLSLGTRSLTTFIRGYMYSYNRYSVFLRRNFAWLLVVFAYITIVLTAMQVGLATDQLSKDGRFQNASYGFTVFSILMPLIGILVIMVVMLGLFIFNLLATISFKNEVEQERLMLVKQHNATKAP